MADSEIIVSALSADGAVGSNVLTWSVTAGVCLSYLVLDAVEVWASATNDRATATKVGETFGLQMTHSGLSANTTRYYWIKARDVSGNHGEWYPESATSGVSATTLTTEPGPNSVGSDELQDDAVQTEHIANSAITSAKIGNAEITSAKIGNGEITNAKIQSLSADKITGGTISATISIDGPTITGGTVRTSSGSNRVEMSSASGQLRVYSSGASIVNLGPSASGSGGILDINSGPRALRALCSTGSSALFIANYGSGAGPGVDIETQGTGGDSHAVRGLNIASGGGDGAVGLSSAAGGYGLYAASGGIGPFTGAHDALHPLDEEPPQPGEIVYDRRVMSRAGIDDTLTVVGVSEALEQRGCVGVVSLVTELTPDAQLAAMPRSRNDKAPPGPTRRRLAERYRRLRINGVGEGQVLVCGRGGDLEPGDFICASSMPGKGQRQNDASGEADDFPRRCTVAKAREAVKFDHDDQVKLVSCIYLCG